MDPGSGQGADEGLVYGATVGSGSGVDGRLSGGGAEVVSGSGCAVTGPDSSPRGPLLGRCFVWPGGRLVAVFCLLGRPACAVLGAFVFGAFASFGAFDVVGFVAGSD